MEINNNFEIVFRCPRDGLKEVVMLSRDVWFAGTNIISPIPDRDPHVIESKNRHSSVEERCRTLQCKRARTQQLQLLQSHSR